MRWPMVRWAIVASVSQLFPIVFGHDGANAKPAFRQRPAIHAGVSPGRSDDRRPQRLLALHRFAVLLPLSHLAQTRLIAADEAAVPCPARLHPGRATSTPIASSSTGSRRRR